MESLLLHTLLTGQKSNPHIDRPSNLENSQCPAFALDLICPGEFNGFDGVARCVLFELPRATQNFPELTKAKAAKMTENTNRLKAEQLPQMMPGILEFQSVSVLGDARQTIWLPCPGD